MLSSCPFLKRRALVKEDLVCQFSWSLPPRNSWSPRISSSLYILGGEWRQNGVPRDHNRHLVGRGTHARLPQEHFLGHYQLASFSFNFSPDDFLLFFSERYWIDFILWLQITPCFAFDVFLLRTLFDTDHVLVFVRFLLSSDIKSEGSIAIVILILQPFHRFTYVTAHSRTHLLLHLCHSLFFNPSFDFPTSQALHLRHLASRPSLPVKVFMN